MNKAYYSIVVPVYNEEENVSILHKELVPVFKELGKPFEIIFVNDGSTDKTEEQLQKLSPITIISFRKNFGQSAALDAGIKNAKGEIIITLDGDRQNDPRDIPEMLNMLGKDCDVVCGWRYKRKDPMSKKFISDVARFLRRFLVSDGVHDAGCTLRVYKKECFEHLDLYGELHRMIPAILRWRGFRICEIKVNHRPRKSGSSKYDWKRVIKGLLDMMGIWFWRKYENRPLHLFGFAGIILTGASTLFIFYLVIMRLFFGYSLSEKIWPLVAVTGFITGVQLFIFGILADLIIKNRTDKSFYSIKEITTK